MKPDRFIPIAERTGLIQPLGQLVLEEACRQIGLWRTIRGYEHLFVSVNVSVHQLIDAGFCERLSGVLAKCGLPSRALHLELTESAVMAQPDDLLAVLDRLVALGFNLSMDDFGTGYSALSRLARLPFTFLKIDRSFLAADSPKDQKILQAMVELARNLEKEVIIEGIEDSEKLERTRLLGCHFGQGFFLGRPMVREAARALVLNQAQKPAVS